MGKKNIGSSFDDFLAEEAILEESTAVAMKRVIAWQIAQEMKAWQELQGQHFAQSGARDNADLIITTA